MRIDAGCYCSQSTSPASLFVVRFTSVASATTNIDRIFAYELLRAHSMCKLYKCVLCVCGWQYMLERVSSSRYNKENVASSQDEIKLGYFSFAIFVRFTMYSLAVNLVEYILRVYVCVASVECRCVVQNIWKIIGKWKKRRQPAAKWEMSRNERWQSYERHTGRMNAKYNVANGWVFMSLRFRCTFPGEKCVKYSEKKLGEWN